MRLINQIKFAEKIKFVNKLHKLQFKNGRCLHRVYTFNGMVCIVFTALLDD